MEVSVDLDVCCNQGQCALAAPEVFRLDCGNLVLLQANPAEELRDDVLDAAESCPVQAISVRG
jgi:ferredoxin